MSSDDEVNNYDGSMATINFGGHGLKIGTVAGAYGVADETPDYLDVDIKGRGWMEKTFGYCGVAYLTGMIGGGTTGMVSGLRNAPNKKFWIKVNSVMNGVGRNGGLAGNMLGSLAFIYSTFETGYEELDLDQYLGPYIGPQPLMVPILSGFSTGFLYKCTSNPRTAALAAVLGGIGAGTLTFGYHEYDKRMGGRRR